MRLLLQSTLCFTLVAVCQAQPPLTLPTSGNNQKASVTQYIGPVRITINYSSPAVHTAAGEDRRGKIWGKLVPYGLAEQGSVNGKPMPWRAGANENTTFTASENVVVEGKPLPAGTYGLHMIPGPEEWTVIFNKNSGAWGSFFYEDSEDALRVTVKPHKHDYREWLAYDFTVRKPSEATVEIQWEDLAVPFTIAANVNDSYITHLRRELTSGQGFDYRAYMSAAQFCVQSNSNLDQGLKWAEAAISLPGIGQQNFDTLGTKAQVLSKLGKAAEAKSAMETAIHLPGTTSLQLHQYGRLLLAAHKNAEALEVFKLNEQRNGDAWPVHVGLARGYSATGDIAKALEHARKALPQAPDPLNKGSLEAMIKTLSEGQPLSQ
jgi:Protein of unknown function (DUF2911)